MLSIPGFAFPYGFTAFSTVFVPLSPVSRIALSATLGLGVGYAAWRALPPRLTTKQFTKLMAGWLAISVVSTILGLLVLMVTAKFMAA